MIQRLAMLSVHTCPLAMLGGKETGGMNVYVRDLGRELSRRGIAVDVYTRSQNPAIARITSLADRARVIHVKAGPERPYSKTRVYNHLDEFVEGVLEQVRHDGIRYDLIYSHYWLSGLVAEALRQRWGIPFVQMFHTLAEMKNRVARTPQEREPELRREKEAYIMRSADRLVAATVNEQQDMVEAYGADPRKIAVIPPGVDLNRFKPLDRAEARQFLGLPPDHRMILFVGRIQPLKGIDILIRALAVAKQREPKLLGDVCLCLIGGDPNPDSEVEQAELERIQKLEAELDLGDLVTRLGAKDQDTLVYYYSAAEMVVMPSLYESFGMVALEAMACGTPVIASDVGGLSLNIEDGYNGYLVPGQNPQALAEKIILLLRYPILREQLAEQARTWVTRFSWPNIADELLELFHQLTGQPLPPNER